MEKNFNEIVNAAGTLQVTNKQALNTTAKGVRADLKERSYIYFVNVFNRMARKNEYMGNVNMLNLRRMYTAVSGENQFSLRLFTQDYLNRPAYVTKYKGALTVQDLQHGDIVTDEKGNEVRISATDPGTLVALKAIAKTESAFLTAFRAVLAPYAAQQDKAQREAEKEARKAERATASKATAAARKALKEQQQQARIDYCKGKINIEQFAAIMAKTA